MARAEAGSSNRGLVLSAAAVADGGGVVDDDAVSLDPAASSPTARGLALLRPGGNGGNGAAGLALALAAMALAAVRALCASNELEEDDDELDKEGGVREGEPFSTSVPSESRRGDDRNGSTAMGRDAKASTKLSVTASSSSTAKDLSAAMLDCGNEREPIRAMATTRGGGSSPELGAPAGVMAPRRCACLSLSLQKSDEAHVGSHSASKNPAPAIRV